MATISKENYLKAIYDLTSKNGENVPTSAIAKELNVSNAAISEMAYKLSLDGFIEHKKYKGVKILTKGKKLATNVLRKHRLWELFLIEILDLNWDEVHSEAEKLEHSTSDNLIDKIDEYLNFPTSDPHGAPIPNKNGGYRSNIKDFPLSDCQTGKSYRIARVNDKSQDLMRYLSQINIAINKKIKIREKLGFDSSIIIEIDSVSHSLSEKVINNIFIKNI